MSLSKRAQDYKHAIQAQSLRSSRDTLYPGQQYTFLAKQLQQADIPESSRDSNHEVGIARLLGAQDHDRCLKFKYSQLDRLLCLPDPNEGRGQVLFLRGHLPSSWINSIGAKYIIDPDFFRRHLDLPCVPKLQSLFATPCLPSLHKRCLTLRINTILCTDSVCINNNRSTYNKRKERSDAKLDDYFARLYVEAQPGDSFVRAYSVMERGFSVLEQDISICVEKNGKGWIAIVWLDSGKDLSLSPRGPWIPSKEGSRNANLTTIPLPVPYHTSHISPSPSQAKERICTKHALRALIALPSHSLPPILPTQFDAFLDEGMASVDAFYALSPIFSFAASSELQFLNLMQTMYEDGLANHETQRDPSGSIQILKAYKELLDRHRSKQEEILQFLQSSAGRQWPHGTTFNTNGTSRSSFLH